MPSLNLKKYFSQFDGDTYWSNPPTNSKTGTCVEACLKMVDCYLTDREISIKDIVKNGDNNPNVTDFDGANKAAHWLGFNLYQHTKATPKMIKEFLGYGHLMIALVYYNSIPKKYRQISYDGWHAILITGYDEKNNSVRYADPAFLGSRRDEGYMNNNKWISWDDLALGWGPTNYILWEVQKAKEEQPSNPEPLPDPKDEEIKSLRKERDTLLNDIFSTPTNEYIAGMTKKAGWEYRVNAANDKASQETKERLQIEKKLVATDKLLNSKIDELEGLKKEMENLDSDYDKQRARVIVLESQKALLEEENAFLKKKLAGIREDNLENIFVKLFKKFISIFNKSKEV